MACGSSLCQKTSCHRWGLVLRTCCPDGGVPCHRGWKPPWRQSVFIRTERHPSTWDSLSPFWIAWRQTGQCGCCGRVAVHFTGTQLSHFSGRLQLSQLLGNSDETRYAQLNDAGNRPVLLSVGEMKALRVPGGPSFPCDSKFTHQFGF